MGPRIVIGVPGLWVTRTDIVTSIAQHSDGFLFAGLVLMDTATKQGCTLEVYDHHPQLHEAFRIAGGGRIADAELAAIAKHRHTLYCVSSDASIETARQMLRFGSALLRAGGLAVKIESSGAAHSATRWKRLADSNELFDLYTAFVTLIGGADWFYSCGMHVFGLPDAEVPRELNVGDATHLLNVFNYYLLAESPSLSDGHTFSVGAGAPRFRLRKTACDTYEVKHAFHNPFGMWRLTSA